MLGSFDVIPAMVWNMKSGRIQPFDKMLQIDAAAPMYAQLYAQQFVNRADEYVVVIDYHNPVERRQQMKVGVQYTNDGFSKHEEAVFNIFECDYLFTCRQVGLDRSGAIKSFSFNQTMAYFNFQDDQPRNQLKLFIVYRHFWTGLRQMPPCIVP